MLKSEYSEIGLDQQLYIIKIIQEKWLTSLWKRPRHISYLEEALWVKDLLNLPVDNIYDVCTCTARG